MLVNAKKILEEAKKNKVAIPHFNINNLEWTKYILEQMNNENYPLILGVSEGAAKYMGGYKVVSNMVNGLLETLNINIPVVLHLDHGSNFESCKKAIDGGFTSVMVDYSSYSLEENIEETKKVVDYAKEKNVSVEAEIGGIGGQEDDVNSGIIYANIDDCIKFVEETKIDFLAPALGSVHGLYKGEPKINFDRMEKISKKTNVPLVLHGATGIPDDMIKKAIQFGTCKININTDFQVAWNKEVRKYIELNPKEYDPRKIIGSGEKAIKNKVKEKIKLFSLK